MLALHFTHTHTHTHCCYQFTPPSCGVNHFYCWLFISGNYDSFWFDDHQHWWGYSVVYKEPVLFRLIRANWKRGLKIGLNFPKCTYRNWIKLSCSTPFSNQAFVNLVLWNIDTAVSTLSFLSSRLLTQHIPFSLFSFYLFAHTVLGNSFLRRFSFIFICALPFIYSSFCNFFRCILFQFFLSLYVFLVFFFADVDVQVV